MIGYECNHIFQRQLNAESFLVAPDQKYVLLQSDSNAEGSRWVIS